MKPGPKMLHRNGHELGENYTENIFLIPYFKKNPDCLDILAEVISSEYLHISVVIRYFLKKTAPPGTMIIL